MIEFILQAPPELLHISYIIYRVFYSYLEKIHCSAVTNTLYTMPYHDLGTPSQSAVTHHNALCLVPDSDSAQLPVSDLLSWQLVFDLFFLKTHPLQICMCQSLL